MAVLVGSGLETQVFNIHRELINHHSLFFQAMMGGQWLESNMGVVFLNDDDPNLFALFREWRYTNPRSCRLGLTVHDVYPNGEDDGHELCDTCVRVILMADRLQCSGFHNAAIDTLIQAWRNRANIEKYMIDYAYEKTVPNAPLRRLLVDMVVLEMDRNDMERDVMATLQDYPQDFVSECFVVAYKALRGKENDPDHNQKFDLDPSACTHHDHPEGTCRPSKQEAGN